MHVADRKPRIVGGVDHERRPRGHHGHELVVVREAEQPRDEMTMLQRVVPVIVSRMAELQIEIGRAHHGDQRADPVIERRGDPGIVSASRCPRHADPVLVDLRPRRQIVQGALSFKLGQTLLSNSHQQELCSAMVPCGDAPLTLAEWVEGQDHKTKFRCVDAESLEVGPRLRIGPPVSVVEQDGRGGALARLGHVEMRWHRDAAQRFVHEFLDLVTIAAQHAGPAGIAGLRRREPLEPECLFELFAQLRPGAIGLVL